MATAFISYSHEDGDFAVSLAERLQDEGLDIVYDQVILRVGDSLIRKISEAIQEGDFLIAIVSPDSIESEWCRHEVALAKTQGINQRRVKVLPVKFRDAPMPPELEDAYYTDADKYGLDGAAHALTVAIRSHQAGRDEEPAQPQNGERPPQQVQRRAGILDDLDDVADRLFDLLAQWDRCRDAGGATNDLRDKQRRLAFALGKIPEDVLAALPLVSFLANPATGWQDYFRTQAPVGVEADLDQELRSARTHLAQGLPLVRRWTLGELIVSQPAPNRDARVHVWEIHRGEETRRVEVYISGTAEWAQHGLPPEVEEARATDGRSAVVAVLSVDDPPGQLSLTTHGISWTLPD
jgi:hypothetical protein